MTERYTEEIEALTEWFKARLTAYPALTLSKPEYTSGTDSLKGDYKQIVDYAFLRWLYERNYELSYNQMCQAFFRAVIDLKKLTIIE